MLAVVRIAGKQYKVAPSQVITVDKIDGKDGDSVTFSDVLLVKGDKEVTLGTPLVKGASVKAKILAQVKGEKIAVRRFKSKVRYRRHTGFRAQLTKLEITGVTTA